MARHGRSRNPIKNIRDQIRLVREQRKLAAEQRRLHNTQRRHHWEKIRQKRREAFGRGVGKVLKTVGNGIREVSKGFKDMAKRGSKTLNKAAKGLGKGIDRTAKKNNDATKPVRDAIKTQQDRRKRRKEAERKARDKAREDFNRKERLKTRSNAAPDGIKTKDTKSAVKDAVQKARKTTTTVSKHNRSKNGKTHEVEQHDRKLNPQEQNRQVADDLLKQSKSKPKKKSFPELKAEKFRGADRGVKDEVNATPPPVQYEPNEVDRITEEVTQKWISGTKVKKTPAKTNVIDLEIEKQRKKNRELGEQAKEIKQDTDRIKGKAPKLTGDEKKDFPAFQKRMKNLDSDLQEERQDDIVRRLKDQIRDSTNQGGG